MRKQVIAAASAAILSTVASTSAHAYLIVSLQVGAGPLLTCDTSTAAGVTACQSNGFSVGTPGGGVFGEKVDFTGTYQGYALDLGSSSSNSPGNTILARIQNSFNNVANLSAGTADLIYTVTGYGFTLPAGPAMTLFGNESQSNSLNPATPQNLTSKYEASAVSSPFTSVANTTATFSLTSSDNMDAAQVNWMRGAGAFSLRDTITFDLAQNASGNFAITGTSTIRAQNRIPEPVSTALVGLGLVGLAFCTRRRKV